MNRYAIIVFALAVLFLRGAFAQTIVPEARGIEGTPEEALRRIERRQSEAEQNMREKQKAKDELRENQTEPPLSSKTDTTKFILKEIIIENAAHLSLFEKRSLTAPLLNREISFNDIELLVRNLTNLLIDKGYSTSRVKIPVGQNISSGKFTLTIINGRIESIEAEEKSRRNSMQLFTVFPFYSGGYLNVHEMEYGLEQMNRVASSNAAMKITPGTEDGMSKIIILGQPGFQLTLEPGVDNLGQKTIGEIRAKLSAGIDNLLSINDSIFFDYAGSPHYDNNREYSRSYTAYFSFPLGFWSLSAMYSRSEYMQIVSGLSTSFRSSGIDTNSVFSADRLIFMKNHNRVKLKTALMLKEKESYIEDAKIETGSRKLSILKGGLDYSGFVFGGYLSVSAFYHRGVRWFNAYRDTEKGADIPKAQFGKYEGGVLWNRQFGLFGRKFSYTASSWGQFGTDVLFSSEKIAVGDLNTVRGFKEDSVSGDRGFYVKNDLAMHDFSFIWKGLGGLKIFAGYDYGLIREKAGREANYGRGRASIMGCAAGISYTSPVIRFMVTYGHRLKAPDFISGDAQAVYVSMSLPLSETYRMIRGSGKPADKTKEE